MVPFKFRILFALSIDLLFHKDKGKPSLYIAYKMNLWISGIAVSRKDVAHNFKWKM